MGRKKKRIRKIKKEKVISKKLITQNTYKSSAFKANEEKVKIKKILKQPTEKRYYNLKDYVVYPKHGVGKILAIEKAVIGDIKITFYKVFVQKEKLTLEKNFEISINEIKEYNNRWFKKYIS